MKIIRGIELKRGSREELLPDFSPDFPHIATRVELDRYDGLRSPWHWHREIELFYLTEGALTYRTAQGSHHFAAGSGALVNSNILHMSSADRDAGPVTALLHLFDPLLISGHGGSRIDRKYVAPLTASPGLELVGLYPERAEHAPILSLLAESFSMAEEDDAYELRLRAALSEIWFQVFRLARPLCGDGAGSNRVNDQMKAMMELIHARYTEKIAVAEIAAAAFISERECFRLFRTHLHMTPLEYATGYRVEMACRMLAGSDDSVTAVGNACGLGSGSYFGKVFRRRLGCSPAEYRGGWRDRDKKRRE